MSSVDLDLLADCQSLLWIPLLPQGERVYRLILEEEEEEEVEVEVRGSSGEDMRRQQAGDESR